MVGHIETACFHCYGGREIIYASHREAEWIRCTSDIRACFGKLFDKESGDSVLLLSPIKTGILLIISKIIPNRFGDNLSAYLHVPYGLDIPGDKLKNIVFSVITALAHNRRDVVSTCLNTISKEEFVLLPQDMQVNSILQERKFAYRYVDSEKEPNSLTMVLGNLFQDYYTRYKYIFLSIDGQHVANTSEHSNLTDLPIKEWRSCEEEGIYSEANKIDSEIATSEIKCNSYEETVSEGLQQEITSEWLKANTEVHGWLSFFFFAIIVGGIFSAIYPIATFNAEDYAGNFCLGAVDIITGLILLGVSIYTVYAFTTRKANAVFWGKFYVILVFLTNIFSLIGGETEGTGMQSTTQVIRSVVWGIIWFLYLTFSEQVQEIIPKSYRKNSPLDWGFLIGIILLPVFLFVVGYSQITSMVQNRENQEAQLKNVELTYNERTDGKVIFTVPDGFECKSENINTEGQNLTVFSIENDAIGNCTMCSDYDNNKSMANFNSYWENWKDADIKLYDMDDVDSGTRHINDRDCLYKITKHNVNGVYVYWRFYLLFDDETGKVFLASFYDSDASTDYVDELLESVKFK